MGQQGRRRRAWLALAVCALAVLAMRVTVQGLPGWAAPAGGAAREALAPLQRAFGGATTAVREAAGFLYRLGRLRRENAELARRVESVDLLEAEAEELRQENRRLRELLDLRSRAAWPSEAPPVAARIIARNPDDWFASAVLGKGSRDGIRPGMAVVAGRGLVGRVTAASSRTAAVLLLTDPQSGVGARVQREESRAQGVVLGQAGRGDVLLMRFFARDADVRRGDRIVTSGYSEVFPAGLPIGTVQEVLDQPGGLVRHAWVKPAADFDRLEEVLVVGAPGDAPARPEG